MPGQARAPVFFMVARERNTRVAVDCGQKRADVAVRPFLCALGGPEGAQMVSIHFQCR